MIVIAKLGGYLHRHGDALPGFECVGRGYCVLNIMTKMMQTYHASAALSRRPMRCHKSVGQVQG